MICVRCREHVEWWPLKDRWANKVADDGITDVWSFLCPAGTPDNLYHQPDENGVY